MRTCDVGRRGAPSQRGRGERAGAELTEGGLLLTTLNLIGSKLTESYVPLSPSAAVAYITSHIKQTPLGQGECSR